MKLLFLDTETTGVEVGKHGVVQISGIVEIDGVVMEEFDFHVRPFTGQVADSRALEIIGKTVAEIKDFPLPAIVYPKILEIFKKYVDRYNKNDKFHLVGQNVKFDYDMMTEWFKRNGDNYFYAYVQYHLIDIITATALFSLAGKMSLQNMKLKTVADFFQIPLEAHNSLNDIRVTRQIFHKYLEKIKNVN